MLGLLGALSDQVPPLQQDAAARSVGLDLVVERVRVRVVAHMEALLLCLEEHAPDHRLVHDQVPQVLFLRTMPLLRREAELDERGGVETEVLGDEHW